MIEQAGRLVESGAFESPFALAFLDRFQALKSGFHRERSVKLRPGSLTSRRVLFGTERESQTVAQWVELLKQAGMPKGAHQRFINRLQDANAVLFAVEETETTVLKVYLEFWELLVRKIKSGQHGKQAFALNQGIKWTAGQHDHWVEDTYYCYPMLTDSEIIVRLSKLLPSPDSNHILSALRPVLVGTDNAGRAPDLVYLEVSDKDNLRRSFDINCYGRKLKVGDCLERLKLLAQKWNIETRSVETALDAVSNQTLGHLSGGYDRNGEPFFTVYYEC